MVLGLRHSDDYVRIVLPSGYPESRIVERLYVTAGLLPKHEDMETYNRQEIAAYNEYRSILSA